MEKDSDIIPVLEAKIKALEEERDRLRPVVNRCALVEEQLQHLRMTRNVFKHDVAVKNVEAVMNAVEAIGKAPEMPSNISFQRRGRLGDAIIGILRAAGRPMHVDEIVPKIRDQKFPSTRATIVGTLARFVKEGVLDRPSPGTYTFRTSADIFS